MKTLKLVTLALTGALVGCNSNSDFNWRPYKDLDGSQQYLTFSEVVTLENNNQSSEYVAYRAKLFGDLKSRETLGTLYPLGRIGQDSAMGTIFLLDGKSLNPHNSDDINLLKKAKAFDFYEFGDMRLGHTQLLFSGNNPKLQAMLKENEQQYGREIAVTNFSEKATIIANVICK